MTEAFKMKVEDLFAIDDKTIFVGQVETSAAYIGESTCKVIIDGTEKGCLTIQGEVLSDGRHIDLWTREKVPFEKKTLTGHQVWLIST